MVEHLYLQKKESLMTAITFLNVTHKSGKKSSVKKTTCH